MGWNCNEVLYAKEIGIATKIEPYIQFIIKSLESISFSYEKGSEETFQENLEEVLFVKDYVTQSSSENIKKTKQKLTTATYLLQISCFIRFSFV